MTCNLPLINNDESDNDLALKVDLNSFSEQKTVNQNNHVPIDNSI